MMTILNRPYDNPADLQAMIGVIKKRPAERAADFPTITDLYEIMGAADGEEQTQLWVTPERQVVGFATVKPADELMWYEVTPEVAGSALEHEILRWAEEQIRLANPSSDQPLMVRLSCSDQHLHRRGVLEQYGFQALPVGTLEMSRSLQGPIPKPVLPPHFTIRSVLGEQEVEALTALHQVAFGTQYLTVEARRSWMRTPEYDAELDLVVMAPDGTLAAYCMCRISPEENALTGRAVGYTDPIAVHPAFQRRGFARALLLTGLQLLKDRGMSSAALSTWGENFAMQKTAESVGFYITATTLIFQKAVNGV